MTMTATDNIEAVFQCIYPQTVAAYHGVEALEQQAKALLKSVQATRSISDSLTDNHDQVQRCMKVEAVVRELAEACEKARVDFGSV